MLSILDWVTNLDPGAVIVHHLRVTAYQVPPALMVSSMQQPLERIAVL